MISSTRGSSRSESEDVGERPQRVVGLRRQRLDADGTSPRRRPPAPRRTAPAWTGSACTASAPSSRRRGDLRGQPAVEAATREHVAGGLEDGGAPVLRGQAAAGSAVWSTTIGPEVSESSLRPQTANAHLHATQRSSRRSVTACTPSSKRSNDCSHDVPGPAVLGLARARPVDRGVERAEALGVVRRVERRLEERAAKDSPSWPGSSSSVCSRRSRSIDRVAAACSVHSTVPWWLVAAALAVELHLAVGRQVGGQDRRRTRRPASACGRGGAAAGPAPRCASSTVAQVWST